MIPLLLKSSLIRHSNGPHGNDSIPCSDPSRFSPDLIDSFPGITESRRVDGWTEAPTVRDPRSTAARMDIESRSSTASSVQVMVQA